MNEALRPHFFRHEYGRLVALLTRRFGAHQLELVEDAAQSALLAAVESWGKTRVPENPAAWLFRVAHNHLIGELRQRARRSELLDTLDDSSSSEDAAVVLLEGEVHDSLLRMLFVCCDDDIPIESQLVLALKTLCGFDVTEIAERLFTTEANVYKRFARARSRLRERQVVHDDLDAAQLAARLPAVHAILYTLFTEGYLSSHANGAIRRELCDEARRLTEVLAEHPIGATPETFALLALMYLHSARMPARQSESGGLVLLEEQDRSRFDQPQIALGLSWLARSASGDAFSRYHAEAGIAAEHCLARTFAETRWDRIVECYELLERLAPSAIHGLSRAVALAESRGAEAGLALLDGLEPSAGLAGSYLWSAVLADLHRRCGHRELASHHRDLALERAPSDAVRATLERRLGSR